MRSGDFATEVSSLPRLARRGEEPGSLAWSGAALLYKGASKGRVVTHSITDSSLVHPRFLNYRETFIALQSRYPDLTEAEFRMWVGPGKRGLVALENKPGRTRCSRLKNPAFRFHWSGCVYNNQSIDALLNCWFPAKQVFRFVPTLRYLTYEQLVDRWQNHASVDIHQFIADRVRDFRKKPNYVVFEFGAFDPLGRLDLPIEDYVFALDQVENREKAWFVGTKGASFRPFREEDARYFSRLPKWTKQEAGYLVQGKVRVSASGHYCYNDLPVVSVYDCYPSYEVQPPEADYADLFSRLSFPMTPLEFIRFCELRRIPLPPALVTKVKEIAGIRPPPDATPLAPAPDNTPQSPSPGRLTKEGPSTPFKEVAKLGYDILKDNNGEPPTADAVFNYLLNGEYRGSVKGKKSELAQWVTNIDASGGEIKLMGGRSLYST